MSQKNVHFVRLLVSDLKRVVLRGTKLTNSATATAYVTGHDRSLTSKMTGWGAVMTGPNRSHTSKMTGLGEVCDWLGGGL